MDAKSKMMVRVMLRVVRRVTQVVGRILGDSVAFERIYPLAERATPNANYPQPSEFFRPGLPLASPSLTVARAGFFGQFDTH